MEGLWVPPSKCTLSGSWFIFVPSLLHDPHRVLTNTLDTFRGHLPAPLRRCPRRTAWASRSSPPRRARKPSGDAAGIDAPGGSPEGTGQSRVAEGQTPTHESSVGVGLAPKYGQYGKANCNQIDQ